MSSVMSVCLGYSSYDLLDLYLLISIHTPPANPTAPIMLNRMISISSHSGNGALPLSNILILVMLKSFIRSMYMICVSSN